MADSGTVIFCELPELRFRELSSLSDLAFFFNDGDVLDGNAKIVKHANIH